MAMMMIEPIHVHVFSRAMHSLDVHPKPSSKQTRFDRIEYVKKWYFPLKIVETPNEQQQQQKEFFVLRFECYVFGFQRSLSYSLTQHRATSQKRSNATRKNKAQTSRWVQLKNKKNI